MAEHTWSEVPVDVVWEGGMRFRGGARGGPTLVVDGDHAAAPSPVEAVVVAVGACSAVDVVEILGKRRTPPTKLEVRVDFARAPTPPRRLVALRLRFLVATDSERTHVERAVALSIEKYCSVASSLAPDTELTWTVEVEPAEEALR